MKKGKILSVISIVLITISLVGCTGKNEKNYNYTEIEANLNNGDYKIEYNNEERFFKSEVNPTTESEKVILDLFKVTISDEYDKFKDLYVQSDLYKDYPNVYKESFEKGMYTEAIVVHNMKILNEDEYTKDSKSKTYYAYMDKLKELNPAEYQIVEVKYTTKLTEKYDEKAKWGSGTWVRYYVVVKETKDAPWRVFDIYGHE